MDRDIIFLKIKDILTRNRFIPDDIKLTEKSKLDNDLLLDSLDMFEIIMEIEEEFNIDIEDSEIIDMKTVSDLITLLQKRIKTWIY